MSSQEFKPGDVVRVKEPSRYIAAFGSKVKDRDAVVLRKWSGHGGDINQYRVEFQKRNGRGKKFEEWMRFGELVLVRAAEEKK